MSNNCEDEISEFLMDHLSDVINLLDDPNVQAYAVVTTISACGATICESLLKMYIAPLPISTIAILDHLAWFYGAELIGVECDCSNFAFCLLVDMRDHGGYDSFKDGMMAKINETYEYKMAWHYIEELKENLFKEAS